MPRTSFERRPSIAVEIEVPSYSDKGQTYTVKAYPQDGTYSCTCNSFQYRQYCRHGDELLARYRDYVRMMRNVAIETGLLIRGGTLVQYSPDIPMEDQIDGD